VSPPTVSRATWYHQASLFLLLATLLPAPATAAEGMWTFDNFPSARVSEELGVEVSADWLARMQRSTARLEGGCTGSFASPEGLVLTNNHCVWGCVRNLSSSERNLSEEGFYASTQEEELRCPGEQVSVLLGTQDVTREVGAATAGKDDEAANEARKQTLGELERACERDTNLECEAVALYAGGQYFLYRYRRFEDVRLVFAPELPIAAFGGDPDNFEFPRYCLDMSFLRVYEDGKPVSTPDFLEWRFEGPAAGEPVFVTGHPGSTQRLLTVAQLERLRNSTLPQYLLRNHELRGRLLQWAETGPEPQRLVSQRILNLDNALKVMRHRLFSLLDDRNLERKRAEEAQLRAGVAADPDLARAYGSAWGDIEKALHAYGPFADQHAWIASGGAFQSTLYGWALSLVRAAEEREKPSADRLEEYRDSELGGLERQLLAPVPVANELEALTLEFSLDKMREWLGPDDPYVRKLLGNDSPKELATRVVQGTRLDDPEVRRRLWEGGRSAIVASEDAMIELARRVDADARALRARYEAEVEAPVAAAAERIARARFAVLGTSHYPDATFTLRVTYGTVRGWDEKGTTIEPFTEIARIFERATGDDPFRLPPSWQQARTRLDGSTRFNLVADTDIIGGNSGSPMVDREGRLVGLVFDGNIHSIAGAYFFDPELNRTVAVHPAVMVESLDKIYRTRRLLEELGIASKAEN
jgi:hypothetical protein